MKKNIACVLAFALLITVVIVFGFSHAEQQYQLAAENAQQVAEAEETPAEKAPVKTVQIKPVREFYEYEIATVNDFVVVNDEDVRITGFTEKADSELVITGENSTVQIATDAGVFPCEVSVVKVKKFRPAVSVCRVVAEMPVEDQKEVFNPTIEYADGTVTVLSPDEFTMSLETGEDAFAADYNRYEIDYHGLTCKGVIEGLKEPYIQSDEFPLQYKDWTTTIKITLEKEFGSDCFIAHIITSDPKALKTTYSESGWGSHSQMSQVMKYRDAIFMTNADWTDKKFAKDVSIVRNGEIVNQREEDGGFYQTLGMDTDGHLYRVTGEVADEIEKNNLYTTWTFRQGFLIENGIELDISQEDLSLEVNKNPRTFIGEVLRDDGLLEYYIIVADGRRLNSSGLTFSEEIAIMLGKNCWIAYNFDGGGTSEMMFDGKILNIPSDGQERSSSDFLYIERGYNPAA